MSIVLIIRQKILRRITIEPGPQSEQILLKLKDLEPAASDAQPELSHRDCGRSSAICVGFDHYLLATLSDHD